MYEDRIDAAHKLVQQLKKYKDKSNVVIVAIPRGALEIGALLSQELHAPLDVILVKKIGALGNPELAIGTVSSKEEFVEPSYRKTHTNYLETQRAILRKQLEQRTMLYRAVRSEIPLKDKTVILTDDGVATGNTLRLAMSLIKRQQPAKLIVAVPVGPPEIIAELKKEADEVICPLQPEYLMAIGQFYRSFPQIEDEQAVELLKRGNQ